MPHKDPGKARAYERERHRKRAAERLAQGLCPRCGKHRPAAGRKVCESCGDKRRATESARYARGKAEGKPYGGRKPESRRRCRAGEEQAMRRHQERREAGLCTNCGDTLPRRGRKPSVNPVARRGERTSGNSTPRGEPPACADGAGGRPQALRSVAPAPPSGTGAIRKRRNAARRGRYAKRRARCLCTDCGEPAQGTRRGASPARVPLVCTRSGEHRGLPLYPPRYTVVELATGEDHGTWDSWEDVAMCLAFAKLSREEVEVITDASPMTTI